MLLVSSPSQTLVGRGPCPSHGAPEEVGNHLPMDQADTRPQRVCQAPRVVHVGGQDGRRACHAQDQVGGHQHRAQVETDRLGRRFGDPPAQHVIGPRPWPEPEAQHPLPPQQKEPTRLRAGHSRKQRAPTARVSAYPSCRSAPRTHLCSPAGCRWLGSPEVLQRDARVSSRSACPWGPSFCLASHRIPQNGCPRSAHSARYLTTSSLSTTQSAAFHILRSRPTSCAPSSSSVLLAPGPAGASRPGQTVAIRRRRTRQASPPTAPVPAAHPRAPGPAVCPG